MTKDEALKMAIESLEFLKGGGYYTGYAEAIDACKEALEQPAQEPEDWMQKYNFRFAPQPLSDDEITKLAWEHNLLDDFPHEFVRAIEAAHGIGVKE